MRAEVTGMINRNLVVHIFQTSAKAVHDSADFENI